MTTPLATDNREAQIRDIWLPLLAVVISIPGCYRSSETGGAGTGAPSETAETQTGTETETADSGRDLGPTPSCRFRLDGSVPLAPEAYSVQWPRLFSDGREIGVILYESTPQYRHTTICLTKVAADLSFVSEQKGIGVNAHSWPEVAKTPEGFGMFWQTDVYEYNNLNAAFQRFDHQGDPLGAMVDLSPFHLCDEAAYGDGRFLASFRIDYESSDEEVLWVSEANIQLMDEAGGEVGGPVVLPRRPRLPVPSALLFRDGTFIVATVDQGFLDFGTMDDAGMAWVERLPLPNGGGVQLAEGHDRLAVLLWLREGEGEHVTVAFQTFDMALNALTDRILLISEAAVIETFPAVASAPDGWVFAWSQAQGERQFIYLLHTDVRGYPIERILLWQGDDYDKHRPAILSEGDSLYVASPYGIRAEIDYYAATPLHLMRLTCGETDVDICAQDAPQAGTDGGVPDESNCAPGVPTVGWRWTGSRCEETTGCFRHCEAPDCPRFALSEADCLWDHRGCRGASL